MPGLKSGRYVGKPKTNGHDQTMNLAGKQRETALAIAAAKAASRPMSDRIAKLVERCSGKPAAMHRVVRQLPPEEQALRDRKLRRRAQIKRNRAAAHA